MAEGIVYGIGWTEKEKNLYPGYKGSLKIIDLSGKFERRPKPIKIRKGAEREQKKRDALFRPAAISVHSNIAVPVVMASSLNAAMSSFVIGPGLPVPMTLPSTLVTGATSAAVPVTKTSSAV